MASLEIHLLGGFDLRVRPHVSHVLPTRKACALVAYLALPAGRVHSRQKLTALLWGGSAEAQAQQSFRQALWAIRRVLGTQSSEALTVHGDRISLRSSEICVDAALFQAAAADRSIGGLERAASLYHGDFLDGLAVDEEPFEEWRFAERERLRELALDVLARLLREQIGQDATEPAIQTALRILSMDPLQEAVHRTLMRLFVSQGRRPAALRQYQQCAGWLARELGTEPDAATRELYRTILRTAVPVGRRISGASMCGPSTQQAPPTEGPFVGRTAEFSLLAATLDRFFDGGPRVTIVAGESGIGKTRLVQELAASPHANGLRVLSTWCYATEQPLPFRPWVDALRGAGASLPSTLVGAIGEPARVQLARAFPELATASGAGATTDVGPLFEAFRELMAALCDMQPTLIVLEDLHWCDEVSVRLLAFLARRLGALPMLIVGTLRSEEVLDGSMLAQALTELEKGGQLNRIELGGLDRDDSLRLARAICRGRSDSAIVDRIQDDLWNLSEGNPFVIVETLRAVAGMKGTAQAPVLAPTVRESVSQRLTRLPAESRQVLEAAAVIGRSFDFPLLLRVAGLEEQACALATDTLVRHRVLEAIDERLAFSHERIRRVAYDDLLPARRALTHRAVALGLESVHAERLEDVVDEIGRHFQCAGDVSKALPYLVRTSEIAAQRYALDAAVRVLKQALEAVSGLPSVTRDRWRLDLELRRAIMLTHLGRHTESLELLKTLASLQERVADAALTSEYFHRLAMSYGYLALPAESRAAGEAALREGEHAQRPDCIGKALFSLASASYLSGAPREAVAYDRRAIPLLERSDARYWLGATFWNLASNLQVMGDFEGALDGATRCERVADSLGDRKLRSLAGVVRARVLSARGEGHAAVECAQQALDTSRDPVAAFTASRALAEAELEAGDIDAAIRGLEAIVAKSGAAPAQLTAMWAACHLGDAYLAAGNLDGAQSAAARALTLNAGLNAFHSALARRLCGRIALAEARCDAAAESLARALEDLERCGASFEAGRTHLDLARVAAARGDGRNRVLAHIVAAIGAFDAAGAPKRRAEAVELAAALGVALT
jgi:DNA-binding SARP family transcriptional activator